MCFKTRSPFFRRCCVRSLLLLLQSVKKNKVFRNVSEAPRKEQELKLKISTTDLSFCDLTFSASYLKKIRKKNTRMMNHKFKKNTILYRTVGYNFKIMN